MKYLWVAYPVLVVILIVIASKFLAGSGQNYFQNMQAKQEKMEAAERRLTQLNKKLSMLNKTDDSKLEADLKTLVELMPAKRDVWSLMVELSSAASASGTKLLSFDGSVGDVREATEGGKKAPGPQDFLKIDATYQMEDFSKLAPLLEKLENSKPLIRIAEVVYDGKVAVITVEGAWSPWEKAYQQGEDPLPEGFESVLASIKEETQNYEDFNGMTKEANFSFVANPF